MEKSSFETVDFEDFDAVEKIPRTLSAIIFQTRSTLSNHARLVCNFERRKECFVNFLRDENSFRLVVPEKRRRLSEER